MNEGIAMDVKKIVREYYELYINECCNIPEMEKSYERNQSPTSIKK